ncbi:hypothetical protein [Paenibacillus larvae]|nr:hypothetical protein [Paenibacillus larvae]
MYVTILAIITACIAVYTLCVNICTLRNLRKAGRELERLLMERKEK